MQVNTISDHVNHAVIGNKQAREAQISSSAEFFNVLSNTLYSNKFLAVIREVLCNAWDIHIQQGITDKPVEITLTDTKLTIRDHGTGIHDDHIVDVYLTYGNSTKKLDGTQTGGFGLGSKAPWAYVDHFQVTSFHNNVKTIYAMSKSSGEVAGKPSATPLVSVPTQETGLEVSMAIASRGDSLKFNSIIRTIAEFGEMNVTLNGEQLKTIAFSQAKHGFMMIQANRMSNVSGGQNNRIFIRYGNVIYPLPVDNALASFAQSASKIMQGIGGDSRWGISNHYNLILQAKPNTISVTPSRESLSMTEHTINSAKTLLEDFIGLMDHGMEAETYKQAEESLAKVWTSGRPADLLTSYNERPGLFTSEGYRSVATTPEIVQDIPSATRAYISRNYPRWKDYKLKDAMMRLKAIESSGLVNRGKVQSFMRELKTRGIGEYSDWFQRTMVLPLMRKLDAVPELSGDKLLVCGQHQPKNNNSMRWRNAANNMVIEATKLSPRPLIDYMPFLRNFVVISYNRMDIQNRLSHFPAMKYWFGQETEMFCYVVSRTKGRPEIAKAFFEKQGMTVVDLTQLLKDEVPEDIAPTPKPVVVKPRKKGLPTLGSAYIDGNIVPKALLKEDCARIEDPEFVVKINPRSTTSSGKKFYHGLSVATHEKIAKVFGDYIGVAVNDNQYSRFLKMGVPSVDTWLNHRICYEIMDNPRLRGYYSVQFDQLSSETRNLFRHHEESMLDVILRSPELRELFGVNHEATEEDLDILHIFNDMYERRYSFPDTNVIARTGEYVRSIPASFNLEALANKLINSKLHRVISPSSVGTYFKPENSHTAAQKKRNEGIIDLLVYAIEG